MGYKNTAGNSSISNEMGQWRYFNSAMDKLGVYKGSTINLQAPEANIPQKVNWMAAAGAAVAGGMGIYEAYREREYKKAEEYLNTHSLSEYKQQIKDGNVPFQYDYLAMSHLKQGIGENIFKLAAQDFQEDVDRNKYRGQSPEQVDAAFYEHVQGSINKFDDGSLGFDTNDYYFNKGVYDTANETRMGMLLEHSKVEDNFLQQQFEQNTIAQVKALANDPNKTPAEIEEALKSKVLEMGYRMTPEFGGQLLKLFTSELANNPQGVTILEHLKDMPVTDDGVTFRQLMGEHEFQQARINAQSFRFNTDAEYRMRFQQNVDKLVREGNVSALQSYLEKHIATNGNVQDKEYEYLLRSIDQAREYLLKSIKEAEAVQKAQLKDAQAKAVQGYVATLWQQYFTDVASGKEVPTLEVFKKYVNDNYGSNTYSANDLKVWQQGVVNGIVMSGDTDQIGTLFDVINRNGTNSQEMSSYMGKALSNRLASVNTAIEKLSNNELLTDEERTQALGDFDMVMGLYHSDPSAVITSMGSNYKDNLNNIRMMDLAVRGKRDPIRYMADVKAADKAMRDEVFTKSGGKYSDVNYQLTYDKLSESFDIDFSNRNAVLNIGGWMVNEIKVRAIQLVRTDQSISMSDAITAAEEQVLSEYTAINNTSIIMPKTLLKSYSNNPSLKGVSADLYMETAEKTLKEILTAEGTGITSPQDYSDSYIGFDENGNQVVIICDYLGRTRGTVSLAEWSKRTTKAIETNFVEAGKRINNINKSIERDIIQYGRGHHFPVF